MSIIIEWDGDGVPEQMKELPKGRYVLVPANALPLTEEEDAGIRAALDSVDAGRVKPADEVRRRLEALLER